MPFWYFVSLLLMVGALFEHRPMTSGAGLFILSAVILWAAVITMTVALLVPINNRIAKLNPGHPYEGWRSDRVRWDCLHRVRVALLLVALILLLIGLFQAQSVPAF